MTTALLDQALVTIDEMLTTKKVPALSGDEIETLCSHLFALRNRNQRIAIAEVAYLNHDDPQALNIFLACTMPLAQRMAENQAYRLSAHPTAWQPYFAYWNVEGVDDLYHEFVAKGALISSQPTKKPWGLREFGLSTPDGHRIVCGEAI